MEVVACRTSKINTIFTAAMAVLVPNIFMVNTSVKKQMQAQQCGSCGVQDLRNKYCIYCSCASSFSQESVSNGFLFFVR